MAARKVSPGIAFRLALIGAIGLAMFAARPVAAQHDHRGAPASNAQTGDEFARQLAAGMEKMHRNMMAPSSTGNPDVDFLAAMIPHHEGAVEMARLVLNYGRDPLVRRLAEEIIAGQQAEIAAMKMRLKILRKGADQNPDGYPSLGATRGTAP